MYLTTFPLQVHDRWNDGSNIWKNICAERLRYWRRHRVVARSDWFSTSASGVAKSDDCAGDVGLFRRTQGSPQSWRHTAS